MRVRTFINDDDDDDVCLSCSGQRASVSPAPADAALLQHVLLPMLVVLSGLHAGSKGRGKITHYIKCCLFKVNPLQ